MSDVDEVIAECRALFVGKRLEELAREPDGTLSLFFEGEYKLLTNAPQIRYVADGTVSGGIPQVLSSIEHFDDMVHLEFSHGGVGEVPDHIGYAIKSISVGELG